ncbi:MAG: ATP-dependent helicase HrpB [Deltaproteobacteria bacterium]|nr:MAG: ATP-dependent helicase HrpB [Deltaproteobacteria bacterium]
MSGAPSQRRLPIEESLPKILAEIQASPLTIVHAPTGAGKTTALPAAMLDDRRDEGMIWTLEPRRIAARAAARFVARRRGGAPGDEVGWHVRFEPRFHSETRLLYLTDGVAVRRLAEDPFLEGVRAVVFDELHERSLNTDLALAMVRRIQSEVRPDLRVVLMSATLDTAELAARFGEAPILSVPSRSFPVTIHYLPRPNTSSPVDRSLFGIRRALEQCKGDVLAFLPGVGEIHGAREGLADLSGVDVLPLYGALSAEEQDRALVPGPRRRVVLATNVAETSLTLEGIEAVVDTGLARVLRHDPGTGLDRLRLEPISQASADQRAGRAGRTAPGVAWRLWTEREHRARPAFDAPAIVRSDLSGLVLQLRAWGEPDPSALPWIEAPPAEAIEAGDRALRSLGLLDAHGLTPLGRRASTLPLHPRLAVLLLLGADAGYPESAALASAILSTRDPFRRHDPTQDSPPPNTTCDLLDRMDAVRSGRDPRLRRGASREIRRIADTLRRLVGTGGSPSDDEGVAIRRALATAWADRLAMRRGPSSSRALMRSGRGVQLTEGSGVREAALFACVVIDDGPRREGTVRLASAIEEDWLSPTTTRALRFNTDLLQVVAREERRLGAIVLHERPLPTPAASEALGLLLDAVRQDPRLLPVDSPEVSALRARIALLHELCPELGLPPPDTRWLEEQVPILLSGRTHLRDLDGASLARELLHLLPWAQRDALEQHAPERLPIPSGREARLRWELGSRPVLAVRMQELFGLEQTPTVAKGRSRVVLHLLAPNGRPAQITDDLGSFWTNTWAEVRKDLRARYPKHAWPEDPLSAAPLRGVKRRRR